MRPLPALLLILALAATTAGEAGGVTRLDEGNRRVTGGVPLGALLAGDSEGDRVWCFVMPDGLAASPAWLFDLPAAAALRIAPTPGAAEVVADVEAAGKLAGVVSLATDHGVAERQATAAGLEGRAVVAALDAATLRVTFDDPPPPPAAAPVDLPSPPAEATAAGPAWPLWWSLPALAAVAGAVVFFKRRPSAPPPAAAVPDDALARAVARLEAKLQVHRHAWARPRRTARARDARRDAMNALSLARRRVVRAT